MKMTSMDIKNKEFKKVLRGYDADDVDEFLEKISDDYEMLYKDNSVLREKVTSLDDKIEHYSKIEATIQNTLLLAQNAAEQAKESAQKEAELIIKNANDSAQRIINKANNDVLAVNDDYEKLKQEFIKFRTKFRNFMNTQLDMFNGLEKEFIKNYSLGNAVDEEIKEKEIEKDGEIDLSKVEDKNFQDDLSEIKSFFVKE